MALILSSLPLLALPYPTILFPGTRLNVEIPLATAEALVTLLNSVDPNTGPSLTVAACPVTSNFSEGPPELAEWATASRVLNVIRPLTRSKRQVYYVSLQGVARVRRKHPLNVPEFWETLESVEVEYVKQTMGLPDRESVAKFKSTAVRLLDRLTRDAATPAKKDGYLRLTDMLEGVSDNRAPWLADIIVGGIPEIAYSDKFSLLSTSDPNARLQHASEIFSKHTSISEVTKKIASAVDESLSKQQKEFFLRQQLAAIQRELQVLSNPKGAAGAGAAAGNGAATPSNGKTSELDDDEVGEANELAHLKAAIEAMIPGSEERKMGAREWRRLKRIPAGSVENGVIRSYLEWLTALPWPKQESSSTTLAPPTRDRAFLLNARVQLDADHYGLEKIKKRLIEYLAVLRLKEMNAAKKEEQAAAAAAVAETSISTSQSPAKNPTPQKKGTVKGPILLFVGPPGVGKTSLGQSVAKALDRPFQRISLGGVRDEAEIRGHRRTYVASGPGLIAQALRRAGRPDPVLLLDEVDKVGASNHHGDVGAALLELLDPEQNGSFNDHYINVPIDLSQVLFICTANTLDTITPPLLDRCEIIQLSGYTYDEKITIARRFLLPKQLKANGLTEAQLELTEPALLHIATQYTQEAGVRSLERAIGAVVRYKAVEWAEHIDDEASTEKTLYRAVVEEHELEKILGIARWDGDERERETRRGIVYGLVVRGQGEGGVLPVETSAVPGSGLLKLTGSLGDVIKESGELALSWVKTHAYDLCITNLPSQDPLKLPTPIDIHLHLPAGAQKKDGPSAGIAMTCAFVSLLTGSCVPSHIAMTGEITLRGRVTPVGGIKEKVLGAHRAGITKVILPWANRKDAESDIPLEVRNEMEFCFVRTIEEGLEAAFGKNKIVWRGGQGHVMESRL